LGLETQEFIPSQAQRGPYVQSAKVFYMPRRLVIGDTSLGRESDLVLSLPGGGERAVLLAFVVVCECVVWYLDFCFLVCSPPVEGPCSSFYSSRDASLQRVEG
jgi:hypothetical protein